MGRCAGSDSSTVLLFWEEEKEKDFLDGLGQEDIEIEDNVRPEDVGEEDAPIIKFVHSVIKDAPAKRASIFIWSLGEQFRFVFGLMEN